MQRHGSLRRLLWARLGTSGHAWTLVDTWRCARTEGCIGCTSGYKSMHRKLGETMPLRLTDKIVALLCSLTDSQIEELPPAERRRLEHMCMRVAVKCAPVAEPPSGVLGALGRRPRDE